MQQPTHTVPGSERSLDPLAISIGNASLLGVGYLLLGRRGLAVATGLVTVVLIAILVTVARPWCQVAARPCSSAT